MNGDMGNPIYNDLSFSNYRRIQSGKNLKKRFLVKLKKRFPSIIKWSKSADHFKKSDALNFSKPERNQISQGFDQIEECVFYYINGVIQMATISKSAN